MGMLAKGSGRILTLPFMMASHSHPHRRNRSFAMRIALRASPSWDDVVILRTLMMVARFGGSSLPFIMASRCPGHLWCRSWGALAGRLWAWASLGACRVLRRAMRVRGAWVGAWVGACP